MSPEAVPRVELEARGWTVRRAVFTPDEVTGFRAAMASAMALARRQGTVLDVDGPEGRTQWIVGDLFSYDQLGAIVLDDRVLRMASEVLGKTPVYFADSTARIGSNGERAWHRDNVDREFDGPDWDDDYPIIRMGIYLQDHARHSGGLCVSERSHLDPRQRRHGRFVDVGAGDLAAWSLRTEHGAEAVRLRFAPNLVLNPRLQTRVPRWARVADTEERMTLFVSFGRRHRLLDRYIDYLGTRDYFQRSVAASAYSGAMHRRIEASGVELAGPALDIARRS